MRLSQGRVSAASNPEPFNADTKGSAEGFDQARTGGGRLLLRTLFRTEGRGTVGLVTNFNNVTEKQS